MALEKARAAKREYVGDLMKNKNVVACGVGYKRVGGVVTQEPAVVVSVIKKLPPEALAVDEIIPRFVGPMPTDIVETGVIRALQAPTDRWRPAPGGVSIGHFNITAGTLGCLVTRGSDLFILSNNHVLANSNAASAGDAILQPGKYDGGFEADRIATLEAFVPIQFETSPPTCLVVSDLVFILNILARLAGSRHRILGYRAAAEANLVDAAIARPWRRTWSSGGSEHRGPQRNRRRASERLSARAAGRRGSPRETSSRSTPPCASATGMPERPSSRTSSSPAP
jgi:hypothetical protein